MDFERKGLSFLLQAMARFARYDFKLLIVGKNDTGKYRKMAERLRLADKVSFIGYYSRIEEIYGVGDMLVLPTLYDPFSNCCLEALACGVPVITTRQNGISELIRDDKNGYVVNAAENVKDLIEKISLLLIDEFREKIVRQVSPSVEGFTIEANAQKILKLFQQVVAEKNLR
jgi:UDP-glucose:(heptosyl)LPS alpha-1,3-glucosyltransferase